VRLYGRHGTDHFISPRVAGNDEVMVYARSYSASLSIICPKITTVMTMCITWTVDSVDSGISGWNCESNSFGPI
jgi:hypothetical protein